MPEQSMGVPPQVEGNRVGNDAVTPTLTLVEAVRSNDFDDARNLLQTLQTFGNFGVVSNTETGLRFRSMPLENEQPFTFGPEDFFVGTDGSRTPFSQDELIEQMRINPRIELRITRNDENGNPHQFSIVLSPYRGSEQFLAQITDITEAEANKVELERQRAALAREREASAAQKAELEKQRAEIASLEQQLQGRLFQNDAERIIDIALQKQLKNPGDETAINNFFSTITDEIKALLANYGSDAEAVLYTVPSELTEASGISQQIKIEKSTATNDISLPVLSDDAIHRALDINPERYDAARTEIDGDNFKDAVLSATFPQEDGTRQILALFPKADTIPEYIKARLPYILKRLRIDTSQLQLAIRLNNEATVDKLMGIHSRRAFLSEAGRRIEEAIRDETEPSPFGICYLDLDNFKPVNDIYGHGAGDVALEEFASLLKSTVRETEILARIGGEEIAVMYHELGPEGLYLAAERLRKAVASMHYPLHKEENGQIFERNEYSASVGVVPVDQILRQARLHEKELFRHLLETGKFRQTKLEANADVQLNKGSGRKSFNQLRTAAIIQITLALGSLAVERAKKLGKNRTCIVDCNTSNNVWEVFESESDRATLRGLESALANLPDHADAEARQRLVDNIQATRDTVVREAVSINDLKLGNISVFGNLDFLEDYVNDSSSSSEVAISS